ncbi:uncharacterized protein LOC132724741 [Ruditapes philippinarum]|uniref:uncharacterized protein LOC132724741 n=1 Tax=Ruditapes philippinarum TaxID=129788 RepID=UPI00295A9CC1|nr:uncharacterized protein LOC132724741 [Ruditapes philippinarum]XP_060565679.1 uncharacterized protein LOC132724741 [Ruditapes philippinarum]
MGPKKNKKKIQRPTDFKEPATTPTRKAAWRASRQASDASSSEAFSPQSPKSLPGSAMRTSPSCSSIESDSSFRSRDRRSSRKRSRVEFDEESRSSIDLDSSCNSSVFCTQCKAKESEVARLMEELTIRENVREHLAEMNAKFKDEENAKEEAWILLKQEQASNETLKVELDEMRAKYEEENRLKDEALNRLSAIASSRLRDNNANITDLSDQNRPTKVAESFSVVYDNEWTDAFDVLQDELGEKETIDFLLNSLMESFKICQEISAENYLEKVQRFIEFPVQREPSGNTHCELPDKLIQQIKEFRKSRATYVINDVIKEVLDKIQSKYDSKEEVQAYKRKCAELCWLMVVQNPPMILSTTAQQQFDTNLYKDYTKRGKYVDYVVWPALLLNEGGPVLSKGVAQGCKKQS